ncbi:hypothetical protein MUK42_35559 [Musa troglodytarum]|uniref:Uncharacterized protein n=1 Tax=Musa troglodytarum TaxID=320322 RepID=A0A9E7E9N2_9LILI|nr:hypothetical protein MUK42_35559 [Musa troglodytarum]
MELGSALAFLDVQFVPRWTQLDQLSVAGIGSARCKRWNLASTSSKFPTHSCRLTERASTCHALGDYTDRDRPLRLSQR